MAPVSFVSTPPEIPSELLPTRTPKLKPSVPSNSQHEVESSVKELAKSLVQGLAHDVSLGKGSSRMSVCIYDTAWASMISKSEDGKTTWLFPRSFDYILDEQNDDGSWRTSTESELDAILNTMAALIACITHRDSPSGDVHSRDKIAFHILRAESWLWTTLPACSMIGCDQVGFEILIPMLYQMLQAQGVSLPSFPAKHRLVQLRDDKMAKFDPDHLYTGAQATIVHCLEALVGSIDFARLEPLLRNGSMMGSPSATAAYLIQSPQWCDQAETFLKRVYANGEGHGMGAFPSAFPAEIFEISWVLSTLLETGLTKQDLGKNEVEILHSSLSEALTAGNGTVGFSRSMLSDADDTSKSLQVSYLLGGSAHDSDALVREFKGATCFRTYTAERNPSFSANCNAVKALLQSKDSEGYHTTVESALAFLCESWCNNQVRDKWNTSIEYSRMLLSQVLVMLMNSKLRDKLPAELTRLASSIILQILSHTLRTQDMDGTWGNGSHEITAYAMLTLTTISTTLRSDTCAGDISMALQQARKFLLASFGKWTPSRVWVEKVTYSSAILTDTYCLAALYASDPERLVIVQTTKVDKKKQQQTAFLAGLPMFHDVKNIGLVMKTAFIEAQGHISRLKQIEHDIFPSSKHTDNKYLEYIPVTWIACNSICGSPLSPNLLWDMMKISMLNFQADNYIETFVGSQFEHSLPAVRRLIDRLCKVTSTWNSYTPSGTSHAQTASTGTVDTLTSNGLGPSTRRHENETCSSTEDLVEVERVLGAYVDYIVSHPSVQSCNNGFEARLRRELATYLQAQITSLEDNKRLDQLSSRTENQDSLSSTLPPRPSLFSWCLTTGANHTSCPFSYAYYLCLISGSHKPTFTTRHSSNSDSARSTPNLRPTVQTDDCFSTPLQEYLSDSLVHHLGILCRMQNDYGSLPRDIVEGNFGCFECAGMQYDSVSTRTKSTSTGGTHNSESQTNDSESWEAKQAGQSKAALLQIIEHEKKNVNFALEGLGRAMEDQPGETTVDQVMSKVRLFVSVTNLYGEIYVQRDIGLKSR